MYNDLSSQSQDSFAHTIFSRWKNI